ncbi:ABC transporter substrate-binding protein [Salipaludibacillus agaradhaerens]|jgi:iron complex transport system substrate-binding protein|uniref:ABC transporter substrate-binding protein n=1 Tax=Salipaludibacillus agaradhaerens TaxID=76935 RepID=A0A9Q4B2M9_SALAG|nr:ABC transporter substrate-binding protein [Salipaludibacillus agaradhaerens]MCR6097243.1 ABC transporter substrate-binding protein [Salipaludibacillus agaradhaerens]MCR6105935.1 ABC transporter substrate-binding protein [Salipaludibacillus agaradhaerens]MCR6113272.1 ABC transporter substrate-binding protein [Salipaludibacillus agaradhaerens]MCR6117968.1 ABC transporter substrate-binding protein [Salipaludibacillus agaradhaerens]
MKNRNNMLSILFILLLILLTACGNEEQNVGVQEETTAGVEGEQGASKLEDDQTTETETRTYEHMEGTTEIPMKPERVVTDWYYGQLVVLGVKPIGTNDYVWKNHPFIERQGTESVGSSFEKIIELDPDLILSWGADKYEDYSKIGPTIPLELNGGPIESVELFGDILGRSEEAQQWITSFEEKSADARARLDEKIGEEETFSIINVFEDTIRVYGFVNMGGYALYEALELKPSPLVESTFKDTEEWYREVSMEVLPDFAGDHIILTTYDPEGNDPTLQELKDSEVWKGLEAVQNNRVYEVEFNHLYFDDPIAIENQVEILTDTILNSEH